MVQPSVGERTRPVNPVPRRGARHQGRRTLVLCPQWWAEHKRRLTHPARADRTDGWQDPGMTTTTTMAELAGLTGQELGTSEWFEVTQESVNLFADATGDHQWIHVDIERATAESPFGGPIAHGYLTLSLLVPLLAEVLV